MKDADTDNLETAELSTEKSVDNGNILMINQPKRTN